MKATPITSALKRKYSPFKKEESTAQKEAKQMLADESGVYVQTKTITPGTAGTAGSAGRVTKPAEKQMSDEAWKEFIANETAEQKQARYAREQAEGRREGFVADKPGTPDQEQTSEVKLKTKVEGDALTPETYRRQVRSGKFAAGVEKRASVDKARAEAKKQGLKGKEKRDYIRNARLDAKAIQKQKIMDLAGEASKNIQKTAEAGKGVSGTYVKGERDKMISEVDDPSKLVARTSKAEKYFGNLPKNISSDLKMKFSPAKFKSYGAKAPLKKLSDLSGDGKITKKDVLIGRGVISKDGSPAKYGNKKSPYKMKGYGNKSY